MDIGGNLDVASVQNTSDSDAQQFSGNLQSNLLQGGKMSGGMNVSTTEAGRAWVDDQTELTGGNAVNINVGSDMHNKGAVIANVDENGVDKGNLNINVGGKLTHEDIKDFDSSVYKNIGYSVGVNPDQNTNGSGNTTPSGGEGDKGTVGFTYQDSKKEGVTRATVGQGNITVGGVEDDGGLNRDLTKTQETTFDESRDAHVSVKVETVIDTGKQVKAFAVGDRQYFTVQIEGITNEQQAKIIAGETKVSWENIDGQTYIALDNGERFLANYQVYSYDDMMMNPALVQGVPGISMNGIMNSPEDAIRNGLMQTGQSEFIVAYDPTYGLLPDLIEVGYNKFFGNRLPTTNINQDDEVLSLYNQENPNAIPSGHSAGGTRLYLAVQNDVSSFENSRLQWFGAPVNRGNITGLAKGNINNTPIVYINPGDFVGNILGGNSEGVADFGYNVLSSPRLFIPSLSPHSNYVCKVCKTGRKED